MKLPQFIDAIISALRCEKDSKNVEVVIDIETPYITCGARPSVGIKCVSMGFDWESGQFRITPEDKLMCCKHNVPQKVVEWNENYHCPKCEHMLSGKRKKTDIKFCSSCGQAVEW